MTQIKRALISVSDKSGLIEFSRFLAEKQVEILSTGGTLRSLQEAGIPAIQVSEYTGSPEILDGRVKTLHPKIHGGLLGRRNLPEHLKQMQEHDIKPIDMVIVNLYPFESTVAKPGCSLEDAIENIDIGGPSMIRSAAKNCESVTVVVDPQDYPGIMQEMDSNSGAVRPETRARLAAKAFQRTAEYDAAIANYLTPRLNPEEAKSFPTKIHLVLNRQAELRYGENPHQSAALYKTNQNTDLSLPDAIVHGGKELSYNNLLDLDAAVRIVRDFSEPTVAILKHNNPCGLASNANLAQAYRLAYDSDPVSAYGSIIGLNRVVDMATAELLHESPFVEAIIAPGYEKGVLDLLLSKKTRRILELSSIAEPAGGKLDIRIIQGGALVQDSDILPDSTYEWNVVTKRQPTPKECESLLFAFKVVKHVKSNAIVLVQGKQTVGVGAGQMNRLESVRIATGAAGERSHGAALGSDAFFPFRDGIDAAAAAGVACIIQPGGSKRDEEAIAAANEAGMAMVFTGFRHFRH